MATLLGLRTDSDRLRNLDFLRFVASVGVVYHHSHEFFVPAAHRAQLVDRTDGLALFVDLFFIISGFVMGFVYDGRLGSAGDYGRFLWKRVARLYPLHVVVLALNAALWAVLLTQGSSDHAPAFTADCFISQALLLQAYYDCGAPPFNGPTWSISVEMGLYIALPLAMAVALRTPLLLAGIAALAFGMVIALTPEAGEYHLGPWLPRGVAGFSAGYLLFRFRERLPACPAWVMPVLALAAISAMMLAAWQPALVVLLLAVAAAAVASDRDGHVLPIVERLCPLGQLTYSLYIWHRLFILALLNVAADELFPGNDLMLWGMTALMVVGLAAASYVGYFTIEVPARRALGSFGRREATHAP